MAEDFGWGGDEAFLDAHNFALELNEVRAMQYEEQQNILRDMAQDEEEDAWENDVPLDGDAESALASCGWGTDEDYCHGEDY